MNALARRIAQGATFWRPGSTKAVSITSAALLMSRLGGAALGVATQIVVARLYGSQSLGIFYLAVSLASILSIVLTMGFPWIVANVVSMAETEADESLLGDFLSSAWRHMAIATVALALPAGIAVWYWPGISEGQRLALAIGIATAPVYAAMRHYGGLANARRRFLLANLPELLFRPALLLVLVGLAWLLSLAMTAASLVAGNLAVAVVLTVAMASMLAFGESPAAVRPAPAAAAQRPDWRRLAFPMVIATLFVNVFADLAIVIVGALVEPHEAGIFGAAIKVAMLFAFAVQSVHQVILRDAADALHAGDRAAVARAVANANGYAVTIMSATLLLVTFAGGFLLSAFGDDFGEGHLCLALLVAGQLVRAAGGPAVQILMITDNQGRAMPIHAASIAVLAILVWLLVPVLGLAGAGLAVIATMTVWSVLLARLAFRLTGLRAAIW